jgi:carboxypeptidase Q
VIVAPVVLLLCAARPAPPAPPPDPAKTTAALVGGALSDGLTWARIADLTDRIGPRLSGSEGFSRAVAWAQAQLASEGLAVKLEPVKLPHWERGEERAEIVENARYGAQPLAITALGGASSTGPGGLTAEVVEVESLEQVAALGDAAHGKILFFNPVMHVAQDYGTATRLRSHGASAASKAGAAAMVVRSLATASFRSPHTGLTHFDDGVAPIPAAAVSTEDAERLHRALQTGPVKLHLLLTPRTLPDVDGFNVVAEIRGREKPAEVVLFAAHLDSWDLAQGAEDDGAGVAMVLEAAHLLSHLPRPPRRTVRLVLYANEENGLAGGTAYALAHAADLSKHVAALEADSGSGRPQGVTLLAGPGGAATLAPLLPPLAVLGAGSIVAGEAGGADISTLAPAGVPFVNVKQDGSRYFDVHHSAADTLDKVKPLDLALSAAAWTALTYALAESETTLPRAEPPPAVK